MINSSPQKSSYVGPVLACSIVVMLAVLLLRLEGRLWMCACGTFKFWVGDTCSSSNSQQLFDPYSFTHVGHGFLFFWIVFLLFRRFGPSWQVVVPVVLELAWEVFENTPFVINRYRTETAALGYTGDTIVNSFGDLTCALAGFLLARWLGWWRSLIVFLMLELVLTFWIRDSLLLEILMLIRPLAAIKHWQLCP
jgi:Protein of unknown function (DUF2585)